MLIKELGVYYAIHVIECWEHLKIALVYLKREQNIYGRQMEKLRHYLEEKMTTTTLKPEVTNFLLSVAVKMAEQETPERKERSLGQIAQKLGELGEWELMRSLNCHRERFAECLRMAE